MKNLFKISAVTAAGIPAVLTAAGQGRQTGEAVSAPAEDRLPDIIMIMTDQ